MLSIKNTRNIADDLYQDAQDVEDDVVWPLNRAALEVEDALSGAESREVDITEQQEYIRLQIDSMIFQLKQIQDNLGG